MKPRNRRLIVIPALIRISTHDPTPPPRTQQSECLNHITMRRVDELRVNVWLIRLAAVQKFFCRTDKLAGEQTDVFVRRPVPLGNTGVTKRSVVERGALPRDVALASLKIRVSVVQIRPWAPLFQDLNQCLSVQGP